MLNSFHFPDKPFSKDNHVKMTYAPPWSPQGGGLTFNLGVNKGDRIFPRASNESGSAPDFTLSTRNGTDVTLSGLFQEKPVFVEIGSFT